MTYDDGGDEVHDTLPAGLMPDEWYHGSSVYMPFDRFDHDKSKPEQHYNGNKHWNSHMGSHWSSEHETASNLAADHGGNTYHATLSFKNPRHYDSEYEMGDEAMAHLRSKHPRDRDLHAGSNSEHVLTEHPRAREMAHEFRDHLKSQGYDGVTYGNEYEGSRGHTCAIAFDPDHIHITDVHPGHEECEKSGPHCEECGHETITPQCMNCGHLTMQSSKTASSDAALPNPYHEGDGAHHTWFHGSPINVGDEPLHSPHHYVRQDFPTPDRWDSGPQMNKVLGTHFSALRDVAKGFIPHNHDGHVYHARLAMKNPAYFPNEFDLDRAVFRHAVKHHPEFTRNEPFNDRMRWSYSTTPRTLAERDRQAEADPDTGHHVHNSIASTMGTMLRMHPAQQKIAESFTQHLRERGHDGIVYGNMVEGPKYHHSAIAFHPDDIHINEITDGKDHPYNESEDRLREIQKSHTGYEDRYAPDAWKNEGNLDHGPWEPYRESADWTPYAKEAMGAAGPDYDNLSFKHSKDHFGHWLKAVHPEHGEVGHINYETMYWPEGKYRSSLQINEVETHPEHQRRGVASQMMNALEKRFPRIPINHGERTIDGSEWARSQYGSPGEFRGDPQGAGYFHGGWTLDGKPFDPAKEGVRRSSLEPVYKYRYGRTGTDEAGQGIAEALHPETGEVIGALRWDVNSEPATVIDMSVDEAHRRKGIGTRLFEMAKAQDSSLVHSDVLTDDGRRFRDSFQAARKPVRRDRLTGLELCRKKVDGFPCKFILGHAQDCNVDWNAAYPDEDEGTTKEAARRYYHASPEEFAPGDRVLPSAQTGNSLWSIEGRGDHVWLMDNPHHAREWNLNQVYEVHPDADVHRHEPDLHLGEDSLDADAHGPQYKASGATVVRKVLDDKGQRIRREASGIPAMSDEAKALLAEHLAQHHPDIEPGGAFADYHHRLTHMDNGERTMGPRAGQDPLFGGMGHDHDPRIDPYKSHWHREAQRLAVQSDGTQWWHGTSPDMATRVKSEGRFPDDYLDDDPAKVGKRQPVWGRGVYMTEGPHETNRFGGEKIPVKHTMKNPFVLKPEMGFPGPLTPPEHLPKASKEVFDREYKVPWDPDYVGKENEAGPALRKALLHAGHDGIVFPGDDEHTRWAVAYHPGDVHYDHEVAKHTAMGANGPDYDNLTFDDQESFGWPHTHGKRLLRAHHPEHGMVGALYYDEKPNYLQIGRVSTYDEHRRRGVATQMMRELESRYPGKPIQHGMRSDDGHAWAESVYGTPVPENLRQKQNWTVNGHEAMGAAGPDYNNLHFKTEDDIEPHRESGSMKIRAIHPQHGDVGYLSFIPRNRDRTADMNDDWTHVDINNLHVDHEHQRRGVASQLMDHLHEITGEDVDIDHGGRTFEGGQWAHGYFGDDEHPSGRKVQDDWAHSAAVRNVSDAASDGDGITEGIMIAIVPPEDMAARLHIEEGESPEQMHVTLAYLGQTPEYDAEHLSELKECVADWARENSPLTATVQGIGTFVKGQEDGQHVLWAAVDAPGLERMHVSLVDHLRSLGYEPRSNHVFTPHMTLAYGKHHFRFVPKIERESWTVDEVWVCIAGRWESVTLGEREVRHDHTAGRGKPRRDAGAGDPVPDGGEGGAGPVGDGAPAPRPLSMHPKAEKDLASLHRDDQRRIMDTIEKIRLDDPTLQTHKLTGKLTGWYSTKASRGHRVVHQPDGSGGVHVGYVGLHEYGDAINRLSALEKIFAIQG